MISEAFSFFLNSFADKTPEWLSAFAASVSSIGVFFVWRQLVATENIAQLQFEDALEREYRDLVKGIPTKALLDSDLDVREYLDSFDEFFSELRKLVSDKFETDPKFWKK